MSGLFSKPKRSRPPTFSDPAVEEARRKLLLAEGKKRGRRSTILTSGRGVQEEVIGVKQTLLGGRP